MPMLIWPPDIRTPYLTTNAIIINDCRRWGWRVEERASQDPYVRSVQHVLSSAPERDHIAVLWDRETVSRQARHERGRRSSSDMSRTSTPDSPRRSIYSSHWSGWEQHQRISERRRSVSRDARLTVSLNEAMEEEGVRPTSPLRRVFARLEDRFGFLEQPRRGRRDVSSDDDEDEGSILPPYSPSDHAPPYAP
ncbi:hypothetical protein EJ04DRAFT_175295 [Polyplosphaeria fusca]|uniref:Uncharacterized protein n=1 Tax=Polyplosphaeria fusca TaxID=682080 RepID=A0A9P4R3K3_9PLEO|nr:hypothetical protein EJ04DRAFT_175295 [Polyplosphaeria fusca]